MQTQISSPVVVVVYDQANQPLDHAKVSLAEVGAKSREVINLAHRSGGYRADHVRPGRYSLRAEAPNMDPQEREVEVGPAGLNTVIILGAAGLPFLYRGQVRVPFDPPRGLLAVSLDPEVGR